MADDRDICERLEDQSIDGSIFLRLNAAKEITALRYYVARLEGDLASEEYQHARTKIALENAQEHSSKQVLDIATLGQEVGRLREALRKLITHALDCEKRLDEFHGLGDDAGSGMSSVVCGARAALAETEKTNG